MCVLEQNASIEANGVQEAYRQYSLSKGDKVFDETMLGKELKRLGIEHKQKRIDGKQKWCYLGIAIKSETLSRCNRVNDHLLLFYFSIFQTSR